MMPFLGTVPFYDGESQAISSEPEETKGRLSKSQIPKMSMQICLVLENGVVEW